MKTIENDYTRKKFFDMILDNYHNYDDDDIVKHQLKTLSKIDLIRFVNYLHMYIGNLYVGINGDGELNLFSC